MYMHFSACTYVNLLSCESLNLRSTSTDEELLGSFASQLSAMTENLSAMDIDKLGALARQAQRVSQQAASELTRRRLAERELFAEEADRHRPAASVQRMPSEHQRKEQHLLEMKERQEREQQQRQQREARTRNREQIANAPQFYGSPGTPGILVLGAHFVDDPADSDSVRLSHLLRSTAVGRFCGVSICRVPERLGFFCHNFKASIPATDAEIVCVDYFWLQRGGDWIAVRYGSNWAAKLLALFTAHRASPRVVLLPYASELFGEHIVPPTLAGGGALLRCTRISASDALVLHPLVVATVSRDAAREQPYFGSWEAQGRVHTHQVTRYVPDGFVAVHRFASDAELHGYLRMMCTAPLPDQGNGGGERDGGEGAVQRWKRALLDMIAGGKIPLADRSLLPPKVRVLLDEWGAGCAVVATIPASWAALGVPDVKSRSQASVLLRHVLRGVVGGHISEERRASVTHGSKKYSWWVLTAEGLSSLPSIARSTDLRQVSHDSRVRGLRTMIEEAMQRELFEQGALTHTHTHVRVRVLASVRHVGRCAHARM